VGTPQAGKTRNSGDRRTLMLPPHTAADKAASTLPLLYLPTTGIRRACIARYPEPHYLKASMRSVCPLSAAMILTASARPVAQAQLAHAAGQFDLTITKSNLSDLWER